MMERIGQGLPDLYAGPTVPDWCIKCRVVRATGDHWGRGDFCPTPDPDRRLSETVATWVADERPAYETVDALERDVERILSGDLTRDREAVNRFLLGSRRRLKEEAA